MDASDCEFAEWDKIGKEHAQKGKSQKEFRNLFNECNEYGIKADRELYRTGWNVGIKDFCTIKNGYEFGKNHSYDGICPKELEKSFLKGYELGREINAIKSKMRMKEHDKSMNELTLNSKERKELRGEITPDELKELNNAKEKDKIIKSELKTLSAKLKKLDSKHKSTLKI